MQSNTGLGTVATNGTVTLTGTNTQFLNTFKVGDTINVSGETVRTIASIPSNTILNVTSAFSTSASNLAYTLAGGDRFVVQGNGNVGIGTTAPASKLQIDAVASGIGLILKANVTTPGDLLQAQDSTGTVLAKIDGTGNLTVKNATINGSLTVNGSTTFSGAITVANGHVKSTQTTAPTIGTPAACATLPSAAITDGSTDSAGSFTITAGTITGPTTCDTVITFNVSYGAAPKAIILSSKNVTSGAKRAFISASAAGTFTVSFAAAPAASEANSFYYWVIE